jgi:hypothetical protein
MSEGARTGMDGEGRQLCVGKGRSKEREVGRFEMIGCSMYSITYCIDDR